MSNHLAIATVTATLQHLLQQAATEAVPGATVSTKRPEEVEEGTPQTRVNIYLYQVSPNRQVRNADLPTRQGNAAMIQRPTTALDLSYLISFYGDEAQLEPQRLLGKTVSTLHAQPVLSPAQIRETIRAVVETDTDHYLTGSDLADQVNHVRFTPGTLNLEEFSKLWSMLTFHAPHALSMIYQASVVLIEADGQPQRALPARGGRFQAGPFQQAVIDQVYAAAGLYEPIVAGSQVTIVGQRLRGEITQVRVGSLAVTPETGPPGDTRLNLTLPSGLQAGVQSVQVVHQAPNGSSGQGQHRAESNLVPFVLRPTITAVEAPDAATLTVTLEPAVGRDQRVVLWLNEFNPPGDRPAQAYSFDAPSQNGIEAEGVDETSAITFALTGVTPGDYLVRVQVDGAESPLAVDTTPNSPTFNQYSSPKVTIPA